ncbi:phosphate ABC transporter ATP-binding protein [Candidatus Geothermarchaeota archaeon]|nr:MAG: phosphate ABC transporter ATP-binding protein [Candidatus Geothermarchaeota archaeon]
MNIKVKIRNLNVWYGKKHILKIFSLDIFENAVTAIIGPSGCGKTTLLRVINRLHETVPGARVDGNVYIDGINIYSDEVNPVEVRRRVGMIFQYPIVFPHLSIYKNVAVGLILNGYKDKEFVRKRVVNSLKEVGLWNEVKDRLDDRATELSGGQKQRLAIARAIALRPEILLMDEPTSSLDPSSTARIESLIIRLKENYTIVLVTHLIQQAARVADYIAFLYDGRLIEYGPADEILKRPKKNLTERYLVREL